MKSLGKQTVLFESYVDNVLTRKRFEQRVVYEKADSTYWVNFLSGKRPIVKRENDSFYWRLDIRSIKATTFDEFVQGLKAKFNA